MPFPAKTEPPILLDMACGVSAWGRVGTRRLYGERLTSGWVLDEEGKETDDPNKAHVLVADGRCERDMPLRWQWTRWLVP